MAKPASSGANPRAPGTRPMGGSIPPGLAKKPGQMPPGQYKKRTGPKPQPTNPGPMKPKAAVGGGGTGGGVGGGGTSGGAGGGSGTTRGLPPRPNVNYEDLSEMVRTKGIQGNEQAVYDRIMAKRGVNQKQAIAIAKRRTAKGLNTAGIQGPNGKPIKKKAVSTTATTGV